MIHSVFRYSYGQPVKGTWAALIEVTEREIYYFRDGRRLVGPTTLLRNGVLDARTGCHSLKLPSDQLGIFQFNHGVLKTVKVGSRPMLRPAIDHYSDFVTGV